MLIKSQVTRFANRVFTSKAGLWLPQSDTLVPRHKNVLIVLNGPRGRRLYATKNIVTNAGDVYYAEVGSQDSPTNAFAELSLSTVDFSPAPAKASDAGDLASVIAGATSAMDANYPQANDQDADNTGAGTDITTWLASYTGAAFNDATIEDGCIHVTGATFGSGTDPLLTAFSLTSFAKTSDDTLKVFVNHTMNGV